MVPSSSLLIPPIPTYIIIDTVFTCRGTFFHYDLDKDFVQCVCVSDAKNKKKKKCCQRTSHVVCRETPVVVVTTAVLCMPSRAPCVVILFTSTVLLLQYNVQRAGVPAILR